jgi:signal transduction histidine kinase
LFVDVPDQMLLGHGFEFAYNVAVLSLPWLLGATIRKLRSHEVELAARALELQAEKDENALQAVFAERVRIARELHDVVAHHVSVMGVQAGAARTVMANQPDKAVAALSSIESSSRQAVAEMHNLLGFLRREDDTEISSPQPGLAQLDDLVINASDEAMTVTLDVDGEPAPVPPTLQLSAYRIIQEALTNTRKHSTATTTSVHLHYIPGRFSVRIIDNGSADTTAAHGSGHGLMGMRERVTMHHGTLDTGTTPGGGFVVHASFPLQAAR